MDLITRAAKQAEDRAIIAREIALLKILEKQLSYRIPQLSSCSLTDYSFTYQSLPGVTLTPDLYHRLTPMQKKKLARELAQFVYELHTLIPVSFAQAIGFTYTPWPMAPDVLRQHVPTLLDQPMRQFFEKFLLVYEKIVKEYTPVFLHHDFHGNNILVNETTGRLCGVIDFEDAAIGDPFQEFRLLYKVDAQLMEEVAENYAQLAGLSYDRQRVHAYYLATEYSRLVETAQERLYKQHKRSKRTIPEIIERIRTYAIRYSPKRGDE